MDRVTKRYIYKAEDNQLNIQFTNYIRPSLQFMPFRYTVVKITRLGFDEYKTYTTNILQLDSLIEHCEQILYISETFDLAGQMTDTYVTNAVYNIRISRFPNTRTTFTVVNGEPGIRGLILDTRYMNAIKKAVRYYRETFIRCQNHMQITASGNTLQAIARRRILATHIEEDRLNQLVHDQNIPTLLRLYVLDPLPGAYKYVHN